MAMPEQFSLRWNDFHSNLSQSFHALLEGEDLVDVTLAAGGQYVHAHKLILSICSPYFKELFKMNPCEHPIVILKDVTHQELRQLLQFMYRGEVHVRQQELSGFLHTAELLQVKGLTGGREKSESPPPVNDESSKLKADEPEQAEWVPGGEDTIATETPAEPAAAAAGSAVVNDEATRSPLKRLLKNTPHKNSYNVKKKSRPAFESLSHPENTEYSSDNEPLIDSDNELFHSLLVLPETKEAVRWNCKTNGVKCPSCHRFFANRYNLKVHIRDKHDTREGTLQCDICQKRMRNPSCLRVHMYHHRKQAAYLSQLNSEAGPMLHVMHNMAGKKWLGDPAAIVDYSYPDTPPPARLALARRQYAREAGSAPSELLVVKHEADETILETSKKEKRVGESRNKAHSAAAAKWDDNRDLAAAIVYRYPVMSPSESPAPEPRPSAREPRPSAREPLAPKREADPETV